MAHGSKLFSNFIVAAWDYYRIIHSRVDYYSVILKIQGFYKPAAIILNLNFQFHKPFLYYILPYTVSTDSDSFHRCAFFLKVKEWKLEKIENDYSQRLLISVWGFKNRVCEYSGEHSHTAGNFLMSWITVKIVFQSWVMRWKYFFFLYNGVFWIDRGKYLTQGKVTYSEE